MMDISLDNLRKRTSPLITKRKCLQRELFNICNKTEIGKSSIYNTKGLKKLYEKYDLTFQELTKILLTGIFQILLTSYLFYNNLFFSIFMMPYMYIYFKEKAKQINQKKKNEMCIQFKDGMQSVSFSLNTGYSIENSFKSACNELAVLYGKESFITKEFNKITVRLGRNENIEDILENFAKKTKVEDIMYFSEVFRYAKRCGGDMIGIINSTAHIISEKNETKREIQTVLSGKKMEQKVMSAIPFAIIAYLKIVSPELIKDLYGNLLGIIMMTVCLAAYLIASMIAKRIVDIDV